MQDRARQTADEIDELREEAVRNTALLDAKDCRIDELRRWMADATSKASDVSSKMQVDLEAERAAAQDAAQCAQVLSADVHNVKAAAEAAMERCVPLPGGLL